MAQSLETAFPYATLPRPAQAVSASVAAQGLHALIDGLIQNWLLDPSGFDLLEVGASVMNIYLRGLGFGGAADECVSG